MATTNHYVVDAERASQVTDALIINKIQYIDCLFFFRHDGMQTAV